MAVSGIKGDRYEDFCGIVIVRLLDELRILENCLSESAKKNEDRACQSTHSHFYPSERYTPYILPVLPSSTLLLAARC